MFQCPHCGQWKAKYNHKDKTFDCEACGHREQVVPKKTACSHCHREYTEFTWFDPSGCPHCHRSFVD